MKIKLFSVLPLTPLVLLSSVSFSTTDFAKEKAVNSSIDFRYASTLQTVKINEPKSNYQQLDKLEISAAKGETESAQFFVNCASNISSYDLSVSNLVLDNSNQISSSNIDVYVEIYTQASSNVLFVGTNGEGTYPDCLIPINYIKNKSENSIEANNNQGFWIDAKVPREASAGEYKGKVTFVADGISKEIELIVNVYDFTMPEVPALSTCYLIWNDWLMDSELDNTTQKQWAYYNKLLEYNITGYAFPSTSAKDFAKTLKTYYSKVNMYGIPYRAISKTRNDWDYYITYMLAIGEQSKIDNINYFDKAYYYFDMFYDEALSFDWRIEQLKEMVETTNYCEEQIINQLIEPGTIIDSSTCEVANTIRNLKHALTTEQYMGDSADNWNEILKMYVQHSKGLADSASIEKYKDLLSDENYTIWGYTTELGDYPSPAVNIPDLPVTARDYYWFDYEIGITGELYWCTNCNVVCNSVSGLRYGPIYDPYHSACHDGVSNGGGYYLYPGMHYGSYDPFPSIRLAVKRDGIDDYSYIKELENRIGAAETKQIISFINENIIKNGKSMVNNDALLNARDVIAKLIEAYDKTNFKINNINYEDGKINLSITSLCDEITINNDKHTSGNIDVTLSNYEKLNINIKKANYSTTFTFDTKAKEIIVNGFEESDKKDIINVQINRNSSYEITNEKSYNGSSSAKVILSGYTDFDKPSNILTYKPEMTIKLADLGLNNGLNSCESISFYVYNASSTERAYEVFAKANINGATARFVYDKVVLHKNVWTKIDISNKSAISLDKNNYSKISGIGLRTDNMYVGNNPYSQTLYIDNLMVGRTK